jgi:hypothetical protein
MPSSTLINTTLAVAAIAAPATADAATPTWQQAAAVSAAVAEDYSARLGADSTWMEGCRRRARGTRRCFIHVSGEVYDCHWRVHVMRYRDGSYGWWTFRAHDSGYGCDEPGADEVPTQGTFDELPY